MQVSRAIARRQGVALLTEGVDRNEKFFKNFLQSHVALLTEGVDRNKQHFARQLI